MYEADEEEEEGSPMILTTLEMVNIVTSGVKKIGV